MEKFVDRLEVLPKRNGAATPNEIRFAVTFVTWSTYSQIQIGVTQTGNWKFRICSWMGYMFYEKKPTAHTRKKLRSHRNCSRMVVKVCHIFDKAKSFCTNYVETKNLFMNECRYRFKVKRTLPIKVLYFTYFTCHLFMYGNIIL